MGGIVLGIADAGANTVNTPGSATGQLNFNALNANGKFNIVVDGEAIEVDLTDLIANDTIANVESQLNAAITAALTNYDTAKGTTGTGDAISGTLSAKVNNQG